MKKIVFAVSCFFLISGSPVFAVKVIEGTDLPTIPAKPKTLLKALSNPVGDVFKRPSELTLQNKQSEDVTVGGLLFFRFQKYLANGTKPANFDIDRAYINIMKRIDGNANFRLTLDAARLNTTTLDTQKSSQQLFDFVKYAYVEIPVKLKEAETVVKIGQQQTVWIDWDEKILDTRFIAKSFVDNEGLMPSADMGIGVSGKFGKSDVDYQATVMNGTGLVPETDSSKSLALRISSTGKNAFWGSFINMTGATLSNLTGDSKLVGGLVGIKQKDGTFYSEYITQGEKYGYSLGALFGLTPNYNFFARTDEYFPSRNSSLDKISRQFYGVIFDYSKDIRFALDLQYITGGPSATVSAGETTSAIYFHTMAKI